MSLFHGQTQFYLYRAHAKLLRRVLRRCLAVGVMGRMVLRKVLIRGS